MFSLFPVLLALHFGVASGLTKEYIPVQVSKNWSDAQQYCKENYKELATVTSDEEHRMIHTLISDKEDHWIGMYREKEDAMRWLWSDGTLVSFSDWGGNQPDNKDGNQSCVELMADGWYNRFCKEKRYFVCNRFVVLVKEKKTWEESLDYCKSKYINLAFPASETKLQDETQGSENQTDWVWTGLHILDGQWLAVSKEPWEQFPSLPSCPDPKYRCGAFNNQTNKWENRDCNEQLNFFCY